MNHPLHRQNLTPDPKLEFFSDWEEPSGRWTRRDWICPEGGEWWDWRQRRKAIQNRQLDRGTRVEVGDEGNETSPVDEVLRGLTANLDVRPDLRYLELDKSLSL